MGQHDDDQSNGFIKVNQNLLLTCKTCMEEAEGEQMYINIELCWKIKQAALKLTNIKRYQKFGRKEE